MNEYPSISLAQTTGSSGIELQEVSQATPQLAVSEWAAVLIILGFLGVLTALVVAGRYDSEVAIAVGPGSYLKLQYVEVHVEGAVKKPGVYQVKAGSLIRDVVVLAEPSNDADLKRIRENAKVRNGQNIVVSAREMLTIYVSGAVQEACEVIVPKGARLHDLCKYIAFTDEADLIKMSSKRYLKAGEQVKVPVKCVKRDKSRISS